MPKSDDPVGDAEGRLLAQREAQVLAEAGRASEVLEVLLRRTTLQEDPRLKALMTDIKRQEGVALRRSFGHIGSRNRLKRPHGSGNPVRDNAPINNLYLDESGVSHGGGGTQGWFSLAGIAMSSHGAEQYVSEADKVKKTFFGQTALTFHEPLMRQRDGRFGFEGDPAKQRDFDSAIDSLIRQSKFVAFGTGIRKAAYQQEFAETGRDPYLPVDVYALAIHLLLERYVDYLWSCGEHPLGKITIEAQGPREDVEHQLAVAETIRFGTQWVSGKSFQSYLAPGVSFVPKQGSHPVELSDMLARDIYEWIRSDCLEEPERWSLWNEKLYQYGDLRSGRFGLKVFPDSDLRPRIEAHRDSVRN